ncbi:M3 family metallopeptidase [Sporocytophaga myxococcoides]|uniref:M3 family metallopeptidase n=1 Tax=Sporocytophaga myxococcoides TaxID=153721 RepID=UPI0004191A77|nr:M3 family metallopeptidase [Sporocytophaga myxococcoides]
MIHKVIYASFFCATALSSIPALSDTVLNRPDMSLTSNFNPADTVLSNNPLLKKWEGPNGGLPPLDKVKTENFKPALEAAMAENLSEIDRITSNPEKPTFENTIAAMEKSGQTLMRVQTIYGIWSSTMSDEAFQAVEQEMEPVMAAFSDKITQNEQLFKRIEAVYNSPEKKKLTPEQQRLTWLYYTNFVRAGAALSPAAKAEVSEINQKLAGLFTKFSQNLLADESEQVVVIEKEEDLAGLPQSLKDAAANAAAKKKKGKWVITNTRSSVDPFLTYASNRALREKVWKMFVNRGDNGDKNDNNAIITEILQLRARRAHLLGFKTHAHWRLENTMAKTPERTIELMEAVWTPAVARVHEEVKDMQALADKEGANINIEPWDYRYYAEKVRKARYDLDQTEVKQYLQLEKLREGMFWVAGELFDFEFSPVSNIPVNYPEVRVWEVKNKKTGAHVGYWYFDAFAREGKRSGAWMNAYRDQQKLIGNVTTIVSNNSNFVQGKEGEPILISWDDAVTLFHEFGHALHGLSSNVTYPSLSGTNVVRDYVEFPSQLLEHWLSTPEVLQRYALHYQTGKPIPATLAEKIKKASTFNQGFATTEYLASALIDMKLHLSELPKINPDSFEAATLKDLGMPRELVMRHRTPQFAHIFSGDSYSAGYYSYLWSDVLTADAFQAFTEANGPYDKNVAAKLSKYVFSVGNTIDPEIGYRGFRGRDPKIDALMKKRGFPVKPQEKKAK